VYRCIYVSGSLYAGCQSFCLCRHFGCLCCYHNVFFFQHTVVLLFSRNPTQNGHKEWTREKKVKLIFSHKLPLTRIGRWRGCLEARQRKICLSKFGWKYAAKMKWGKKKKLRLGANGKLFTVVPKWCNFACSCNSISCQRKPVSLCSPIEVKHSFPTPSSASSLNSGLPTPPSSTQFKILSKNCLAIPVVFFSTPAPQNFNCPPTKLRWAYSARKMGRYLCAYVYWGLQQTCIM